MTSDWTQDYFRFKTFIESMRDAIIVENENREVSMVNQAFCDLFQIPAPPEALQGSDCSQSAEQVKHMFSDPDGFVSRIDELLAAKLPVEQDVLIMTDGRHLERDFLPIFKDGNYVGLVWIYKDLTRHYELESRLERYHRAALELSLQDPLTGIGNKRYLDSVIEQRFLVTDTYTDSASLAFIDIDHFKMINDQLGHETGDKVLVEFADYLKASVRSTDILARIGGEEFIIIMPQTSLLDAEKRMQTIHSRYRSQAITDRDVTFSAGIAFTENGAELRSSFDRADKALYRAKEAGRNRIFLSE